MAMVTRWFELEFSFEWKNWTRHFFVDLVIVNILQQVLPMNVIEKALMSQHLLEDNLSDCNVDLSFKKD